MAGEGYDVGIGCSGCEFDDDGRCGGDVGGVDFYGDGGCPAGGGGGFPSV